MKEVAISSKTPIIIPQNVNVLQQRKQLRAASIVHIREYYHAHQVKDEALGTPLDADRTISSSTIRGTPKPIIRNQTAQANSKLRGANPKAKVFYLIGFQNLLGVGGHPKDPKFLSHFSWSRGPP